MNFAALVVLFVATAALVACGGTSSSRTGAQLRADATAAVLRAQADGVQLVEAAREADAQAQRATDAVVNATSTQRAIDAQATAAQRSQDATATALAQPTATATSTPQPTATATPLPTMTATATLEASATATLEPTAVASETVQAVASVGREGQLGGDWKSLVLILGLAVLFIGGVLFAFRLIERS